MLLRCESFEPPMSQLGQTEKHSARADVFHSSPKNGRWFNTLRASNFMEYRSEVTRLDWRTTSRRVRLA